MFVASGLQDIRGGGMLAFKGVNITGNVRGLRLGLPALVCAPRLLLQWLLW